ncbi:HNH endonuclease signature motif containing protein [Arthrobacter sp. MYb227]|uniref:HNH endonuclease signature motif containing protein n=1 Tax=Arthrobacter sp. MYb227 TaxID=1848601 RepID=UPI0015E40615|nr:HNH endonuclease signature motif containing protein [Arthrobacter sp. MYb227]
MQTDQFINLTTTGGTPGHQVSPDDELRALITAQQMVKELTRRVAAHTNSPVRAILFAHTVEDLHRTIAHGQLLAARTAERTLAHELPQATFTTLRQVHDDPTEYLAGNVELPQDPRTVPTGRPVFKDTTSLLTGILHINFFAARDRVEATHRFLPGTDASGAQTPPMFPRLAKDLAEGNADPGDLKTGAKKLEDLAPHINTTTDPAGLAQDLETQVAESVVHEDSRSTNKLFAGIKNSLTDGKTELPPEIMRSRLGMHHRGCIDGLEEFILRVMPKDAEELLAMCASIDNARTKAGDRSALAAQALATNPAAPGPEESTVSDTSSPSNAVPNSADCPPTTIPDSAASEVSLSFPDFLVDPATGDPLTDPHRIHELTLDPPTPSNGFSTPIQGTNSGATTGIPDVTTFDDGLTVPQRHLQGLLNLIRAAGKPTGSTKITGLPSPKLFVVATLKELQELASTHGITGHGKHLTAAELRHALCTSGVIPMVLDGKSQILDLGREQRFFPDYMREAILALYGGCIYPGCTVPPEHCEIDHVEDFALGGSTKIEDGGPFCRGHHLDRHDDLIQIVRDTDGLYSVRLPKHLDPEQKLRRNNFWRNWAQNPYQPPPNPKTRRSESPPDSPSLF